MFPFLVRACVYIEGIRDSFFFLGGVGGFVGIDITCMRM